MTRRHFLTLATCLAGETLLSSPGQAATCGGSFNRATYDHYVGLFNAADPGFTHYFADNINFVNFLHGKAEVLAFYGARRPYVKETLEVLFFCSDAEGAAAEVRGEFRCIQDCDDPKIFGRSLKASEVQRAHGYLFYVLDEKVRLPRSKDRRQKLCSPGR